VKKLKGNKIYLSGYYPKEEYQRVKEGLEESKKIAEERKNESKIYYLSDVELK